MPTKPAPNPPPSKVNRHIFRFGQYKVVAALSRRATWAFQHPPRVTLLAHAHPGSPFLPSPSPTMLTLLTHVARLDQSTPHLPLCLLLHCRHGCPFRLPATSFQRTSPQGRIGRRQRSCRGKALKGDISLSPFPLLCFFFSSSSLNRP
jgi:hypothetical protein